MAPCSASMPTDSLAANRNFKLGKKLETLLSCNALPTPAAIGSEFLRRAVRALGLTFLHQQTQPRWWDVVCHDVMLIKTCELLLDQQSNQVAWRARLQLQCARRAAAPFQLSSRASGTLVVD